ncbi:hypothetical protein CJ669_09090 [Aliarcobacter cryaerophilus]|uniref:Nudix hydrolase domain-containing protein n=2 Tax=Aliarcobacter cryaerophilus TaxID=28198 RepID=A0A2S9SKN2_9BACT|nr:hypothetical protein CJ669_09090 [Aliarcobacter cryaerophilus]
MAWYFKMVNNELKSRLREKTKDINNLETSNREGIYLFLSFDLANATEYKIRNYKWHDTFNKFYNHITKEIIDENSPIKNAKIWKFIGDEVLFYLKITDKVELFKTLPYVYKIVKNIENKLGKESHYYDKLYIKTTIWIADILDEQDLSKEEFSTEKATNIIFSPPFENTNVLLNKPDFLGFEIDLGFRISKFSHHSVIAIGAKLAYLLYKNRQDLKDKYKLDYQTGEIYKNLKIVDYASLKGIWRNHKYPIIWYSENWDIDSMFLYDEHFNNEFIENLKDKIINKSLEGIDKLEKIFRDINQIDDVDKIIEKISTTKPERNIEIQLDKVSEVHVALICFNNDKTKILGALRKENKKRFPNMWEFGCGQISLNETFEDTAKRTYKEDFGIDINILNENIPIATYSFEDSLNQKVPGLILIGYQIDKKNIEQKKYKEVKWLSLEDINSINTISINQYVDNFKENALKAFEIIKN